MRTTEVVCGNNEICNAIGETANLVLTGAGYCIVQGDLECLAWEAAGAGVGRIFSTVGKRMQSTKRYIAITSQIRAMRTFLESLDEFPPKP